MPSHELTGTGFARKLTRSVYSLSASLMLCSYRAISDIAPSKLVTFMVDGALFSSSLDVPIHSSTRFFSATNPSAMSAAAVPADAPSYPASQSGP
jgi:hypothetical protein